ncbi:unannotated protein [freshwater metagenome]|uniref:pantoate--beta-alanine ligase (AMP-forming) n=1 Tax=freshwater metagenome TaxID=449393 RepID=A0A6J6AUP3_9ZZZZ|nr:pantoate--beta-alanine ligase [Actinomycetota bacterium]MSW14822.1 pantoate--beta-alanine ligase [Actinomycetota bacterium]MSW99067.1 pantoate--beta-alanine ligase [Actinomycetota bacterium]MSY82316.1 pantoate--beta-alanine ligase [Actinomycetota bacterium]MSZ45341.1 pantoate--beta-alanine ligase [Actinomycetota bacterium]
MELELKHPLAFVPTMGALHAGHQSLITIAKSYAPNVLVSVFVNPLQFENPDDLAQYPRDLDGDAVKAESAGATFVWSPTIEEIYPAQPSIINAGELGNLFEGVHRFGHFDGVLTVVKRLFDLINPQFAVFGEKDFQQFFLIKKMVKELALPIEIIQAPIVREADGLAMSSRNIRLTSDSRTISLVLSRALESAAQEIDINKARKVLHEVLRAEPGFTIDYAEIIDENDFTLATEATLSPRAIIAGWINDLRLIDNMQMNCGGTR